MESTQVTGQEAQSRKTRVQKVEILFLREKLKCGVAAVASTQ